MVLWSSLQPPSTFSHHSCIPYSKGEKPPHYTDHGMFFSAPQKTFLVYLQQTQTLFPHSLLSLLMFVTLILSHEIMAMSFGKLFFRDENNLMISVFVWNWSLTPFYALQGALVSLPLESGRGPEK